MAVFNEDTRVKIPATIQFMRLGYAYQSLKDIDLHTETRIAINRFKPSIERINDKHFSDEDITKLLDDIHSVIRNNDMGRAFYHWLIHPLDQVRLIDFDNIDNNDFAVVDELTFGKAGTEGEKDGSFRPDINILINGIPLAFLEVKKPNNEGGIQAEFRRMLDRRLEKPEYKKYFNMLQVVSFSNNMEYEDEDDSAMAEDVKAGSFYTTPNGFRTTFSFFREERPKMTGFQDIPMDKVKAVLKDNHYNPSEADSPEFYTNLDPQTPCNRFVTSLFDKERILYFLHYGITYVNGAVPEKHIMRYPQFFASQALVERLENGGKSGIIWHTQGSGKTELAAFSTRILRDYYAKKSITARFYYVVDRLDLLTQVSGEMSKRGLNVVNVNSKAEFEKELNKPVSDHVATNTDGEITVVNIQKFDDEMPAAKNEYNAKIQRVIFIDEAHRSYKTDGEFFKNLMLVDRDAVYVALTGTPLLSKKERSNLKFGDYIHKYFYDKSIADGYTLRIKKESIETTARSEIKKNLDLENPHVAKSDATESEDYINALCRFIEKDFQYFRLTNADDTIGGMIVCSSNPQAKKIKRWFDEQSDLQAGLVISDEEIPSSVNKQTQIAFKETLKPDILVVHQMLTTGYDVNRLKKMYLLRNAREHTLLQTISRVNRPYKSPTGKVYQYGYIVDFVDISEEYDRTIEMYLKEIEADFGDDGEGNGGLTGLIIGPDDVNVKYKKYASELDSMIDTTNLERFSKQLTFMTKDAFYLYNSKDVAFAYEDTIQYLINRIEQPDFYKQFDAALERISRYPRNDAFAVQTADGERTDLFEPLTEKVEGKQRNNFAKAIFGIIAQDKFDFSDAFSGGFDFYSSIFEYLIKNYNVASGTYAEYFTPQTISSIMAKILVGMSDTIKAAEIYDGTAGSGSLILHLAHELGQESNMNRAVVYTQDISTKSSRFLRLNMMLNGFTESLGNIVRGDTLESPAHFNTPHEPDSGLKRFDYITTNPPFKTDFSATRDRIEQNWEDTNRFFAGIPNIPKAKKDSMAIYLMFVQHAMYSLKDDGKAAIVVPTGFLTAKSSIEMKIRTKMVEEKMLMGVVSMPSNIFANTGTNVSVIFLDKASKHDDVILIDASKLGEKVKEGKNQRTVLREDEVSKIIDTFINRNVIDDFSVVVPFEDITEKNYSFSAGQYFEVKIEYVDITAEEFESKMNEYKSSLMEKFQKGHELEQSIMEQLGGLQYEI